MLHSTLHPDFEIFYYNDRNPVFIVTFQELGDTNINLLLHPNQRHRVILEERTEKDDEANILSVTQAIY